MQENAGEKKSWELSWSHLVSATLIRVGGQSLHDCFVRELEKSSMYGIRENKSLSLSSTFHGFVYMRKNHIKCKQKVTYSLSSLNLQPSL